METKKIRNRKKLQKNRLRIIGIALSITALAVLTLFLYLGSLQPQGPKLKHIESNMELNIEIADDEPERQKGLMGRTNLEEDFAMLFVYPDSQRRVFWMLNTPESLDIIFLDENMKIINFYKDTMPNQTSTRYASRRPTMYIVESKAGLINRLNIKPGDQFTLNN